MRWILLACSNFIVANLFIALMLSGKSTNDFEVSEYSLSIIHYANNQESIERIFGSPFIELKDKWVYKSENGTKLSITWKNERINSAYIDFNDFKDFNDISHIEGNHLVTVKTPKGTMEQGWIKIAIPENGQTFTINRDGSVSKIMWNRPWEVGSEKTDIIGILNILKSLPPYLVVK